MPPALDRSSLKSIPNGFASSDTKNNHQISVYIPSSIAHRPLAGEQSSANDERATDVRRLLQVGLALAASFVLFLALWFWGTRGHRRRVGGVVRL
jgi:hypothetical protein